jgi:hypothetical protein
MSGSPSSNLDSLFAAARNDAPSSAVQDDVWLRIASQTAPAAAAAAGTTAVVAKTAAGTKLLAIGAAIGATGAAIAVLAITDISSRTSSAGIPTANVARHVPAGVGPNGQSVRLADPMPRARAEAPSSSPPSGSANKHTSPGAHPADGEASSLGTSAWGVDDASVLAEEARLVTEARSALLRGEAERALTLVRSTRRLPVRALEPEELGLEARALRALGRSDEALAAELRLKSKFPNHSLSR